MYSAYVHLSHLVTEGDKRTPVVSNICLQVQQQQPMTRKYIGVNSYCCSSLLREYTISNLIRTVISFCSN